jgi:hypothetical protein
MGGKSGGGGEDTFVPQNQAMLLAQQQAPVQQRARAAQLGTPYQPPTPQEQQDAQNREMMRAKASRPARINPAMDPNAIAGSGARGDATLGDIAAQSVLPTRRRARRRPPPPDEATPPATSGSV